MSTVQEIESAVETLSDDEYGLFREWLSEFEQKKETFSVHPEWKKELRRRIDDIESGVTKGISAEQVFAEVHFKAQVDAGLQELDEGKGIPHEVVEERMSKWLVT